MALEVEGLEQQDEDHASRGSIVTGLPDSYRTSVLPEANEPFAELGFPRENVLCTSTKKRRIL